MDNKNFGSRLKEAREKAKLTQSDVCKKLGISKPQIISNYERGASSPSLETLKELSRLYDVSTDWLLFGREYETRNMELKDFLRILTGNADRFFKIVSSGLIEAFKPIITYHNLISDERAVFGIDFFTETQVSKFFENWGKFLDLKENGALSEELYMTCINGLIEEYAPAIQSLVDAYEYQSKIPEL